MYIHTHTTHKRENMADVLFWRGKKHSLNGTGYLPSKGAKARVLPNAETVNADLGGFQELHAGMHVAVHQSSIIVVQHGRSPQAAILREL